MMSDPKEDINEQIIRLREKWHELLVIIVISIIVAFLVNVFAPPLETLVKVITQALKISENIAYFLLCVLFILTLIICILAVGHFYYGRPIIFWYGFPLLLNKETGVIYPYYRSEYTLTGTLALQRYLQENKEKLSHIDNLSLESPLLRDLLEVLLVDWLVSTTVNKVELLSLSSKPKIKYPKFGKQLKTLRTQDILAMFGENRFVKYLRGSSPIMFSEIKFPEKLTIKCRRYRNEHISFGPDEDPLWVPLASELSVEGSLLTPLKKLRVISYTSGFGPGEPLLLWLECKARDITIGPDTIEFVDATGRRVVISGEEHKKLGFWIRVNVGICVLVEMRSFLFLHPKFEQTLDWVRKNVQ